MLSLLVLACLRCHSCAGGVGGVSVSGNAAEHIGEHQHVVGRAYARVGSEHFFTAGVLPTGADPLSLSPGGTPAYHNAVLSVRLLCDSGAGAVLDYRPGVDIVISLAERSGVRVSTCRLSVPLMTSLHASSSSVWTLAIQSLHMQRLAHVNAAGLSPASGTSSPLMSPPLASPHLAVSRCTL